MTKKTIYEIEEAYSERASWRTRISFSPRPCPPTSRPRSARHRFHSGGSEGGELYLCRPVFSPTTHDDRYKVGDVAKA
jgi:hypothetical protein